MSEQWTATTGFFVLCWLGIKTLMPLREFTRSCSSLMVSQSSWNSNFAFIGFEHWSSTTVYVLDILFLQVLRRSIYYLTFRKRMPFHQTPPWVLLASSRRCRVLWGPSWIPICLCWSWGLSLPFGRSYLSFFQIYPGGRRYHIYIRILKDICGRQGICRHCLLDHFSISCSYFFCTVDPFRRFLAVRLPSWVTFWLCCVELMAVRVPDSRRLVFISRLGLDRIARMNLQWLWESTGKESYRF